MKIKFSKKIVFILGIVICICMLAAGLVWWFLPYFHSIEGSDNKAGYRYFIKDNKIFLEKYFKDETIVYIPECIKGRKVVVRGYCFSGADIEEAYVPAAIEIRESAFVNCDKLRKVQFSTITISESMFRRDKNLEEIRAENGVVRIERRAFSDCTKLETIDFIKDVEYLGSYAFANTNIKELPQMENLEYVGNRVFKNTPWEKEQQGDYVIIGNTLQLYKGSEQVVRIPEEITVVRSAFAYEEDAEYPIQISEVYIPNTVKTIDCFAFLNQKDVIVYIPDSVIEVTKLDYAKEDKMEGNVKIVTTAGSYAEEYAQKYGIEYEIVDGWD